MQRKATLAAAPSKGRFGARAGARPTIAIEEVPNDGSEQTGGGSAAYQSKSMAEEMLSGAEAREASIDSFKTDEGEIEGDKQNESTTKAAVEDVVAKKSEEKKKETLASRSEEKKDVKHQPVKSTI